MRFSINLLRIDLPHLAYLCTPLVSLLCCLVFLCGLLFFRSVLTSLSSFWFLRPSRKKTFLFCCCHLWAGVVEILLENWLLTSSTDLWHSSLRSEVILLRQVFLCKVPSTWNPFLFIDWCYIHWYLCTKTDCLYAAILKVLLPPVSH